MSENKHPTSHSPAVSRAALILDILAAHGAPLGVSEIARSLEAPRSTAANILGALEQSELVVRVDNTFGLGSLLTHLARAYLSQVELIPKFYEACRDLRLGSEETVLLAELDQAEIVYLARHEGAKLFRIVGTVGGRSPARWSALGLATLADLPDAELDQLLPTDDEEPDQSDVGLESRELIEATRARGFAIDDEVSTPGLVSVAKSLPAQDSRRFAVGITLLKAGVDDDKLEAVAKELTELIDAVSP